jgi:hypothetical protein
VILSRLVLRPVSPKIWGRFLPQHVVTTGLLWYKMASTRMPRAPRQCSTTMPTCRMQIVYPARKRRNYRFGQKSTGVNDTLTSSVVKLQKFLSG